MSALDALNRSGLSMVDDLTWINRYWSDSRFRAYCEAERERERARCHDAIDVGMAGLNAKQEQRWREEEQ